MTMRFAAIADIHGNCAALEAVLADIAAQGIADIVNLGDVASGPLHARRTIDLLMQRNIVTVRGNHDRYLIEQSPQAMGSWERPAYAELDTVHLDWLRTQAARFDVDVLDRFAAFAMLAVQGPRARALVQRLADGPLPSYRFRQRHVALDLVPIASAFLMLGHVTGFGEFHDDAVRGALGDIEGGSDVAKPHAGVVGDAQQGPGVIGEEVPIGHPTSVAGF